MVFTGPATLLHKGTSVEWMGGDQLSAPRWELCSYVTNHSVLTTVTVLSLLVQICRKDKKKKKKPLISKELLWLLSGNGLILLFYLYVTLSHDAACPKSSSSGQSRDWARLVVKVFDLLIFAVRFQICHRATEYLFLKKIIRKINVWLWNCCCFCCREVITLVYFSIW